MTFFTTSSCILRSPPLHSYENYILSVIASYELVSINTSASYFLFNEENQSLVAQIPSPDFLIKSPKHSFLIANVIISATDHHPTLQMNSEEIKEGKEALSSLWKKLTASAEKSPRPTVDEENNSSSLGLSEQISAINTLTIPKDHCSLTNAKIDECTATKPKEIKENKERSEERRVGKE